MDDSSFNIGTKPYLIKSSQKDPLDADALVINHQATLIIQLSEWGMQMIEGSFPRLMTPSDTRTGGTGLQSLD